MPRKVLDVGNCSPDHGSIARMLSKHFDVELAQCDQKTDTLAYLKANQVDLVLINRKLDIDYTDGIEILKAIKADPEIASVPVMLISNYEEHQAAAVSLGAIPGFGKLQLASPQTIERLSAVLTPKT